jgi:hypothetical protein
MVFLSMCVCFVMNTGTDTDTGTYTHSERTSASVLHLEGITTQQRAHGYLECVNWTVLLHVGKAGAPGQFSLSVLSGLL